MCVSVRSELLFHVLGGKQLPDTIKTSLVFSFEIILLYLMLEAPWGKV